MGFSPYAAIVWGQWHKTRGTLLWTLAGTLAATVLLWFVTRYEIGGFTGEPGRDLVITSVFIALATGIPAAAFLWDARISESLRESPSPFF